MGFNYDLTMIKPKKEMVGFNYWDLMLQMILYLCKIM